MDKIIEIILTCALTCLGTALITFHVTKIKFRKRHDCFVKEKFEKLETSVKTIIDPNVINTKFDTLEKNIRLVIEAIFRTNGLGEKYRQNYLQLIKEDEIQSNLKI